MSTATDRRAALERQVETVVRGCIHSRPQYSIVDDVLYVLAAEEAEVLEALTAVVARGTVVDEGMDSIGQRLYSPGTVPGFVDPVRVMFACMRETGTKKNSDRAFCHGGGTVIVERARWEAGKLMVICPKCGRRLCQWYRGLDAQFHDLEPALHDVRARLAHKAGPLTEDERHQLAAVNAKIAGRPAPEREAQLTPEQMASQTALAKIVIAELEAEEAAARIEKDRAARAAREAVAPSVRALAVSLLVLVVDRDVTVNGGWRADRARRGLRQIHRAAARRAASRAARAVALQGARLRMGDLDLDHLLLLEDQLRPMLRDRLVIDADTAHAFADAMNTWIEREAP